MADTKAAGIIDGLLIVRGITRTELARRCGVTKQVLYTWFKRGLKDAHVRRCLKALDTDQNAYDRCGVSA